MQKGSRGGKRTLVRRSSCVNLYADQAIQIQAIMESVGERKEAPVLRVLLDEALAARRRKSVDHREPEPPPASMDLAEILHTIQTLLLKLVRQGETALRAQDISLMLVQENLAETTAGRKIVWNRLEVPCLLQAGMLPQEIDDRLAAELGEAQDSAYGLAEEISQRSDGQANNNVPVLIEELSVEDDLQREDSER